MPGIQSFRVISPDTSQGVRERVDDLRTREAAGEKLGEQAMLSVTITPIGTDIPREGSTPQALDVRYVRAHDLNDGTMMVDGELDEGNRTIHFVVDKDGSQPVEGQMVVD